ncbi:MAG: hypothetical protein PSX81_06025 [bacterium]|nr:hypothetical protein [bacterium]
MKKIINLECIKRIFCLALIVSLSFKLTFAQTWTKKVEVTDDEYSVGVVEASNSDLISVSNTTYTDIYSTVHTDIIITRLPSNGGSTSPPSGTNTVIWKKSYSFSTIQRALGFIVDRAGDIIIVGNCISGASNYGFILKIKGSNGAIIFNKKTDAGYTGCRLLRIIQMNSSGTNSSDHYIVLGAIAGVYTEKHFVARIDTAGVKQWAFDYDIVSGSNFYNELVYSIVQASGGDIVLGGGANKDYGYKHIIIRLNAVNGNVLSHKYFNETFSRNQSLDNAVAIPGTNYVAFLIGRNVNFSQQHGIIIYDVTTESIIRNTDIVLKSPADVNLVTRGGVLRYNTSTQELLIGAYMAASLNVWSDWFIETIDYSTLAIKKTYKFGDLNRHFVNIYSGGYSSANYLASNTDVIIGTDLKDISSSKSKLLLSKLSLTNNISCYDEVPSALAKMEYTTPTTLTINKTAANISTLACSTGTVTLVINDICASAGCSEVSTFCGNIGFESGAYNSEWVGYMGAACPDKTYGNGFCHSFYKVDFSDTNTNPSKSTNPTYNTNIAGRILIQTSGTDPNVSALPVLCPGSGSYSLRLENLTADKLNKEATKITKTMVVPSSNPGVLLYKYALVFEDPKDKHKDYEKPFFKVRVLLLDNTTCEKTGEIECASHGVYANSSDPEVKYNFKNVSGTDFYYKDWSTVAIPLNDYAGKKIRIEFIVSDCADGAHVGYAYLDGACLNDQPTFTSCDGAGNRELEAPAGFETYWWSGPGIIGDNSTKKIKVEEPGGYTLIGTSESLCSLEYKVDFTACTKPPAPTCNISAFTATPSSCSSANNNYNLNGTVTFTTPPANGVLIISDGYLSQLYYAPFVSSLTFTINNLMADGKPHTLTAKFYANSFISPDYISCQSSLNYTAPNPTATADIACENCLTSFSPEPGKYIVSAWVKELGTNPDIENYTNPFIEISFMIGGSPTTLSKIRSTGKIIDKWQRVFFEFSIPVGATNISINLGTDAGSALFDDIRIHPANGSFVSYVYDPVSLKLVATLDDNNYATIYEYDDEGTLLRVKKETERGIMTIKESRENSPKR